MQISIVRLNAQQLQLKSFDSQLGVCSPIPVPSFYLARQLTARCIFSLLLFSPIKVRCVFPTIIFMVKLLGIAFLQKESRFTYWILSRRGITFCKLSVLTSHRFSQTGGAGFLYDDSPHQRSPVAQQGAKFRKILKKCEKNRKKSIQCETI